MSAISFGPDRSPRYDTILTGHFREGRSYRTVRPAGTGDWLIILTLSGAGRFEHAGGAEAIAVPGDIVLIRPSTPQDYGVSQDSGNWELLWAHFQPREEWAAWIKAFPEESPGFYRLTVSDNETRRSVEDGLARVHRQATGALRGRELFAMNALEEVLLWCRTLYPEPAADMRDPRVAAVMEFIQSQMGRGLSVDEMASHGGLSVSRLTQLFRRDTGMTPAQFLESHRLARACTLLLRTRHSIQRIAGEVGYENPFYFTLRFKRATGLSPTEYRYR
jgi:AraC family transcriptional regulator of arabinose operon